MHGPEARGVMLLYSLECRSDSIMAPAECVRLNHPSCLQHGPTDQTAQDRQIEHWRGELRNLGAERLQHTLRICLACRPTRRVDDNESGLRAGLDRDVRHRCCCSWCQ